MEIHLKLQYHTTIILVEVCMNISVVIPVHNSVPFLESCLSSLLPQLDAGDEVLLLENGSTDHSWDLCKEYSEKDTRIHAFNLGPCGVSHARNEGIQRAACDWIMFLDSDDWLSNDALAEAHSRSLCEQADILSFGYVAIDGNDTVFGEDSTVDPVSDAPINVPSRILVKSALRFARFGKEAESFGFDHNTIWTCWAKFFRRDFLLENEILFPEELILSEDTFFMVHAYLKVDTILSYPKKIYRYRVNESSVSRNLQPKHLENNSHLRKKMYTLLRDIDTDRMYREELAAFLTRKFIEEITFLQDSHILTSGEAVDYIHKSMKPSYMACSIRRCGYTNIISGKKSSLKYGYILWCLKHRKEFLLFK